MPLTTRLRRYGRLDAAQATPLERMPFVEKTYARGETIIRRGDPVENVLVMTSGWAARSRVVRSGNRQIIHILLAGDLMTADAFVLKRMDHQIEALSTAVVRFVKPGDLRRALESSPGLSAALWWAAAQEDSLIREHVVRVGRRPALERVSHFLLELHRRLLMVGQATEGAMILPITQEEIGDALGLSNVHVNKMLRDLERRGLLRRRKTVLQIEDRAAMARFCDFDEVHFHLDDAA
ncbi:MAG: Crp/Fnr family transcriptional regulator [Pseudomonadota bacterium]